MNKMMALISVLMISTTVFAATLDSKNVAAKIEDGKMVVELAGKAAQTLYFSLNVEAVGHFGMIQTQTKTTANVECISSILGDIPGQMTPVQYVCTVVTDLK